MEPYILGVLIGLVVGFVAGWLCCETRVWQQIKKNARPAQPCPCCGYPNCGHAHPYHQEAAMAFLKKEKV